MAHGFKTGGRKKGSLNKVTSEMKAAIAASGETPLEYMLRLPLALGLPLALVDSNLKLDCAKS